VTPAASTGTRGSGLLIWALACAGLMCIAAFWGVGQGVGHLRRRHRGRQRRLDPRRSRAHCGAAVLCVGTRACGRRHLAAAGGLVRCGV
jgi:hypothetical protein